MTAQVGNHDQYTARWPDEVAGLVLVDPPRCAPWPRLGQEDPIVDGDDTEPGCIRLDWSDSQAELARMVPSLSPLIASRAVVVSASDGHAQRHPPTIRWYEPLTLAEVDSFRQVSQREWVRRIAALHVVADTAGHFVHRDQPDLVAHVAGAVVDAARRGAPVDLVGVDLAAAVGRLRPARS